MSKIDLPCYPWLVSKHEGRFVTNTYSGSLGTLTDQGCVSVRTFNYRVYVDISSGEENSFRLLAETYIIQPWICGGNKTDFERAEFESSQKGVKDAEEWLVRTAAKYGF
ncbi:MAG: hypothetical protein IJZ03_06225 [Clostridia bacterium]|nr:hypothetical protein [Clostridia bacterium]